MTLTVLKTTLCLRLGPAGAFVIRLISELRSFQSENAPKRGVRLLSVAFDTAGQLHSDRHGNVCAVNMRTSASKPLKDLVTV